jgi:hypothetical protein
MMKLLLILTATLAFSGPVSAQSTMRVLPTRQGMTDSRQADYLRLTAEAFDVSQYREVRVQPIHDSNGQLDHLLVYLLANGFHRVDFGAIYLDANFQPRLVDKQYRLNKADYLDQPGTEVAAVCPNPATEFIAFAPNQIQLEQQVTIDVANAAIAKGLKTVQLLLNDATRANYMAYLACPNIKGNFYDGDSNPTEFITVDGVITSDDIKLMRWNYSITNIWLACQAFNDPMYSAVVVSAQTQKYAAGINNLQIGPSDNAGKCAMIAAINGSPMTGAFKQCYQQYDVPGDQWGFAGNGSDYFGQH